MVIYWEPTPDGGLRQVIVNTVTTRLYFKKASGDDSVFAGDGLLTRLREAAKKFEGVSDVTREEDETIVVCGSSDGDTFPDEEVTKILEDEAAKLGVEMTLDRVTKVL
eukprot:Blabericola_migrator_1__1628@NODE_1436_length_4551_cov_82_274978_g955_i0_p2_GENE_NODE_1436_length_4551_cov_82_274978_g955_i0NODE_1436_length_4551_cov_82_274978_g955_i0_p2_ORF_typecomplete_len108_score24_15_NODE_1436_length_4551_cov_82_274978_g955_i010531376